MSKFFLVFYGVDFLLSLIKCLNVWWMCSPVKKVRLVFWRPVEPPLPAIKQSFSERLYQYRQKTWTLVQSCLQCGFSLWKFAVLNLCTALQSGWRFAAVLRIIVLFHLLQALAAIQNASRLTLEYFGLHRSSWLSQWLQGAQVPWSNISTLASLVHGTLF